MRALNPGSRAARARRRPKPSLRVALAPSEANRSEISFVVVIVSILITLDIAVSSFENRLDDVHYERDDDDAD